MGSVQEKILKVIAPQNGTTPGPGTLMATENPRAMPVEAAEDPAINQMTIRAIDPETGPKAGPGTDQVTPAADHAAPVADQVAPAADQLAQAVDQLAPAADQLAPAADQLAPAADQATVLPKFLETPGADQTDQETLKRPPVRARVLAAPVTVNLSCNRTRRASGFVFV